MEEENTRTISAREAEEFGEFQRQKKIWKVKEDIARLEPSADMRELTLARLKEICAAAKRLNAYAVKVNPLYVRQAKGFLKGSSVRLIARVWGYGEGSFKGNLYELKRAFRDGADEAELFLSVSAMKNKHYAYLRKLMKRAARAAKGRILCARTDEDALDKEEQTVFFRLVRQAGIKVIFLRDLALLDDIRKDWGADLTVKSCAADKEAFHALSERGVARIGTKNADEIAGGLLGEVDGRDGENENQTVI